MTEPKDQTFDEKVGGHCPFCTGTFSAGYSGDKRETVMHSLPPCDRFVKLSPDRYLHAVRTTLQGAS